MPEIPAISKHAKLTPLEGNAVTFLEEDISMRLDEPAFLDILQTATTFEELLLKLSLAGSSLVKNLANVSSSLVHTLLDNVASNWILFNWTSIDPQTCSNHAYAILKELAEEIDLSEHFTPEAVLEILADFAHAIDSAYDQYRIDTANKLKDLKAKLMSRMSIGFDKKA